MSVPWKKEVYYYLTQKLGSEDLAEEWLFTSRDIFNGQSAMDFIDSVIENTRFGHDEAWKQVLLSAKRVLP